MNRLEPRVDVNTTDEPNVVSLVVDAHGPRRVTRSPAPTQARDLAEALNTAADAAEHEHDHWWKLARRRRTRPNARPTPDGLVRIYLGPLSVDVTTSEAIHHADKIVDTVEDLEARP